MNWKLAGMAGTAITVIALSGASAVAGANKFSGNVSLAVGQSFEDDSLAFAAFDDSFTSISGDAKLNIAFSSNLNLQLDFLGVGSFADDTGTGISLDRNAGFQGAAHLYWRSNQYAIGLFAGAGMSAGAEFGGNSLDAEYYFAGVEGQYYWNNFTFGLAGGYLDSNVDNVGFPSDFLYSNAWFTNAEVRWYATPKVAVTANVGYIDGEAFAGFAGGADVDTLHWGAKVSYQPEEKEPLTLWVAYEGRTTEAEFPGFTADKDTHTVKIGVTFHFGAEGSQVERDRSGPSFNTMDYGAIVVGG